MQHNCTTLQWIAFLAVAIVILAAAPFYAISAEHPATTIHYREVTGDKELFFSWSEKNRNDGTIVITLIEGERTFINICAETGETIEWHYTHGNKVTVHAWRKDGRIYLQGMDDGKSINLSKKVDDRPWFQPLSYSLRTFLTSPEQQTSFWTIRATTYDIYAMEAKKIGAEKIDTVSGLERTQLVEIRVQGFLSTFWHCTYWFRESDGLFLRYQSVHGAAGTEQTVVNIDSIVTMREEDHI